MILAFLSNVYFSIKPFRRSFEKSSSVNHDYNYYNFEHIAFYFIFNQNGLPIILF